MLTGVREAVRVLRMLKGDTEDEANAAANAVDAGLPTKKRKQVCNAGSPLDHVIVAARAVLQGVLRFLSSHPAVFQGTLSRQVMCRPAYWQGDSLMTRKPTTHHLQMFIAILQRP